MIVNHPSAAKRFRQSGVSLVTAIFLLLLMSVLAAAMVTLVNGEHINLAADVTGARAYQAARAGAEWGMYQLDPNGQTATLPNCVNGTPAVPGHAVTVTCSSSDYSEAGRQIRIYRISSIARPSSARQPGIERLVEVTLGKCRDSAITTAPYDC